MAPINQPGRGDVHVDGPLTEIVIAFAQNPDVFVADRVFPILSVSKQTDKYFQIPKGDWFRDEMKKRAAGALSAQRTHRVSTDSYACDVWALHEMLADQIRANYDAPLDAEELSGELYSYWVSPKPIPGSAEFLAKLTVPVCVVSNIDTADLESAISSLGWRFSAIVTSESCRSYKPRPEPFEAALRTLDCAASCVLHVGDSIGSDLVGAASLGIPSAWVNPRRRSLPREVSSEPVHVVPTVLDLLSQMG